MLQKLLENHVLSTLTMVLVITMGSIAYNKMPREKNPSFDFNAVAVVSGLSGASTLDIEKLLTVPMETAVAKVSDVRTVSSVSQEGFSTITVRFNDIDAATYERRITDLRREIQNAASSLPKEATSPIISAVNSSNSFPSAAVMVYGMANDDNLRKQASYVKKDLERMKGVDRVAGIGLRDPEFQIKFYLDRLQGLGISPTTLADTVRAHFRDVSAGTVRINEKQWVVRLIGAINDLEYLAKLPIMTAKGEVPLETVAQISRSRQKATGAVHFQGKPAIMINLTKKANANTLKLLDDINVYIEERNKVGSATGVNLTLLYDQTGSIRSSIDVMESNAFYGLILVTLTTWIFLGPKIALLTTIGLPFTLAGTFALLSIFGFTLNNPVLLGIVISLGMLVDDAVVVVETIYFRLQRGGDAALEVLKGLKEVIGPVTSAVLTTCAAFLPLILLPGVLGKFMMVVPLVVTAALAISLIEAFWMLPSHIRSWDVSFEHKGKGQILREKMTKKIQYFYSRWLIRAFRHPILILGGSGLVFILSLMIIATGVVRVNFFAFDSYRVFYIDVELNPGTAMDDTLKKMIYIEKKIRDSAEPNEIRAVATAVGQANGKKGDHLGRILITLQPQTGHLRQLKTVVDALRPVVSDVPGTHNINIVTFTDVPPSPAINVKIRGDNFEDLEEAIESMRGILEAMSTTHDIKVDDNKGSMQLSFKLDVDATRRAGLNPDMVSRMVRLLVDGEVVASVQDKGENVQIRLVSAADKWLDIDQFMRQTISLPGGGGEIPLAEIMHPTVEQGIGKIYHYKFRRTMSIQAELDKTKINTLQANNDIQAEWAKIAHKFPNVTLDFSGELDDIKESLDSLSTLFLFGLLLIYLILGTQFNSFWQPLLIMITIPMSFCGVVFGLLISHNAMSLFTLYGVVALAGIVVNDDIVLISAANDRRALGMSRLTAAIFAARRRFVPVMITTFTTIAGLFSLATGIAGFSVMWGPVAIVIVWGLAFATFLTLVMLPLMYYLLSPKDEDVSEKQTFVDKLTLLLTQLMKFVPAQSVPALFTAQKKAKEKETDILINKEGIRLMKEGKFWDAINVFEKAAARSPNNKSLNLNAAQAMLVLMQKQGVDSGFLKRAKRYLDRVEVKHADDKRFRQLSKIYAQLSSTI